MVAGGVAVAVPALGHASAGTFTIVTLTSSENPSAYGEQVVLNATVIPATGTAVPDGSVTFVDGTTDLGTVDLDGNGQAALAESALGVGTHSIVADYSGSTNFDPSSSALLTQTVTTQGSMTFVIATVNPSTYGQSVIFVVTVIAESGTATPTGSVTLLDGSDAVGSTALASGAGVVADADFSAGSHTITAQYSGDGNFAGSTSPPVIEAVDQSATSVQLTSSANPSLLGQPVTMTATITPASGTGETGTVTFAGPDGTLGTAPVDTTGAAALAVSTLAAGDTPVTATYSGDVNFAGSGSAPLTQSVDLPATGTSLTSSSDPSVVDTPLTLTARVTGAGATPTGTVTFLDGTTTLGTASLDATGTASLTLSSLGVGDHQLGASYGGDALNAPSQAATLTQTVTQAASQVTLTSSANPVDYPAAVTLTASVSTNHSGAGGSVTFLDGTTTLGTADLDTAGQASLTVTGLAVGDHVLTAAYGGDAQTLGSTSAALTETVAPAVTAVTLASSENPAPVGVAITLTATVTGAGATPTGTVTLLDGTTTLGTATLDATGTASLTLSSLAVGAHSLTASYGGDTLDAPSQSSTTTQTISPVSAPAPTTTSLTSSENPAPSAAAVTLTATVTGPGATPTGMVAFLDGTATLGIASLDPSGRASLTLSSLTLGAHSLTAVYGGDAGHAGSTSAMLSETISAATSRTSLSVSPNPAWVGQAVTLTATVASTGQKPRGTVTFSDGGHTIGSARLHDGRAVLITTFREAGDRGIVAAYAGGGGIGASTSASVSLTVRQHPPCCHPGDPWNDPHCGPPARLSDDR